MKRLFISREIGENSIFNRELSRQFSITGISLIDFEAIPFEYPKQTFDWLFFYSKNGVKYFFEQLDKRIPLPKIATMGMGTASSLIPFEYRAHFIGLGNPEAVAYQFLDFAKHQSILFPQAQTSKQSIQKILGEKINSQSLVVYNNLKKTILPSHLPKNDIFVFTSPLNVEAYLDIFPIHPKQKVISIGPSTSSYLETRNINSFIEAPNPSEAAIALAIQHFK